MRVTNVAGPPTFSAEALSPKCHTRCVYPLTTSRLRLIPASTDLLDADFAWQTSGNDAALRFLLSVNAVSEWPPIGSGHDISALEFFRSKLVATPFSEEWYAYYVCLGKELVGSAGFFGPPSGGDVEIGYSICTAFRRQGIASEAVEALARKAKQFGVETMSARTLPDNGASIDLLLKAGFDEEVSNDEHRLFRKSL